jgi:hypothetical protein
MVTMQAKSLKSNKNGAYATLFTIAFLLIWFKILFLNLIRTSVDDFNVAYSLVPRAE